MVRSHSVHSGVRCPTSQSCDGTRRAAMQSPTCVVVSQKFPVTLPQSTQGLHKDSTVPAASVSRFDTCNPFGGGWSSSDMRSTRCYPHRGRKRPLSGMCISNLTDTPTNKGSQAISPVSDWAFTGPQAVFHVKLSRDRKRSFT